LFLENCFQLHNTFFRKIHWSTTMMDTSFCRLLLYSTLTPGRIFIFHWQICAILLMITFGIITTMMSNDCSKLAQTLLSGFFISQISRGV
jgi:hypothetical protein